jgi:arabinose-5-phosphate isomerase
MTDNITLQQLGRSVIELEAQAVSALAPRINDDFARACRLILACEGRVVVVGMGKSGHIGSKIAATLASTGTPAFFVHPGEASHGDLGMITPPDLVIAISNSGETSEILTILPIIKRMGAKLISLTGNAASTLAQQADVNLDVGVDKEACPLNLAPTSSTTVTLVMGDALAVALLKSRGFTTDDFARSHPGGKLGRRLLLYVSDVMHTGEHIPLVPDGASLREALLEMTSKGLGMTGVIDQDRRLCGIYTDGDLRRTLNTGIDVYSARVADVMTRHPKTTRADKLAAETVQLMRTLKINGLFAVDDDNRVTGALNMQDLLKAGVV